MPTRDNGAVTGHRRTGGWSLGGAVGPLFYTSYAGSTGDRGPVQRFHSDVQNEIYCMLGRRPRNDGSLQRAEPALGPDPDVLACRSLLVLYSVDYLSDSQCALEWSVFRERMQRRLWRTGEPADALVGVLWRPDSLVLPRAVAETGQLLDDLGEGYQEPDVPGLQRDPSAWERYRKLVRRVAERLTRAARTPLPAMSSAESGTVEPYFGPAQPRRTRRGQPPSQAPRPLARHLVVALLAAPDPRWSGCAAPSTPTRKPRRNGVPFVPRATSPRRHRRAGGVCLRCRAADLRHSGRHRRGPAERLGGVRRSGGAGGSVDDRSSVFSSALGSTHAFRSARGSGRHRTAASGRGEPAECGPAA